MQGKTSCTNFATLYVARAVGMPSAELHNFATNSPSSHAHTQAHAQLFHLHIQMPHQGSGMPGCAQPEDIS